MIIDKSTLLVYGTREQSKQAVEIAEKYTPCAVLYGIDGVYIGSIWKDDGYPLLDTVALTIQQNIPGIHVTFKERQEALT